MLGMNEQKMKINTKTKKKTQWTFAVTLIILFNVILTYQT